MTTQGIKPELKNLMTWAELSQWSRTHHTDGSITVTDYSGGECFGRTVARYRYDRITNHWVIGSLELKGSLT